MEVKLARPKGDAAVTAARREDILKAAFEVFGRAGFRGGTLSQIAEIVGVTEAGILHHFKSKANLLLAVLEYRDRLTADRMDLTHVKPQDFVAVWLDLIEFNSTFPGIVELYCILSAEATAADHPAHEFFRNRYTWVINLTQGAIEQMENYGWLREHMSPQDVARALIALSDGLQVQWLLDRNWDMVEEQRNFFRGILTDEGLQANNLDSVRLAR